MSFTIRSSPGLGLLLAVALLSAACRRQPQPANAPAGAAPLVQSSCAAADPILVEVVPGDLSTDVAAGGISVLARWGDGQRLGPERLAVLARSFELRTWPALVPVPHDVATTDATPPVRPLALAERAKGSASGAASGPLTSPPPPAPAPPPTHAVIRLVPRSTLAAGWYVVRAGALPAPFVWQNPADVTRQSDGSAITRFRVGSAPLASTAHVYEKGGGRTVVMVRLSEPLLLAPGRTLETAAQLADAAGRALPCKVTNPDGLRAPVRRVRALCQGALPGRVALRLASTLTSAKGRPLTEPSIDIEPGRLDRCGKGCRGSRLRLAAATNLP